MRRASSFEKSLVAIDSRSGFDWTSSAGQVASTDGALLFDSAGGEPLALRLTGEAKRWKQYILYRRERLADDPGEEPPPEPPPPDPGTGGPEPAPA